MFVHYALSPFYPEDVNIGSIWFYFNFIMAAAIIGALPAQYARLRRAGEVCGPDSPVTREYLLAAAVFYFTVLMAMVFVWNWFDDLTLALGESQSSVRNIFWSVINPVFVLLIGVTGARLWRDAG